MAAYWLSGPRPGHATISDATQWHHAHRGPRCGKSSCRYRYQPRQMQRSVSGTWRAPCLDAPSQLLLLAGREHGRTIPLADSTALIKASSFVGPADATTERER